MALPDSFLDELVARSDIVEVVQRYVPMKKSGANYFGLCPFHNEKSPSFSVSPDKQIFHCFGCGEGGGVIQFIMKIENLPFLEAVKLLADACGMQMPDQTEGSEALRKERMRLQEMNKEAARFFHAALLEREGEAALSYLSGRGLSKRTITNFGLGFAKDSWSALLDHLVERGYAKAEIERAGLAVRGGKGGLYDRFRNRVMFPIIDIRGNVIAFGGRVMDDSTPKYLNSPDTPIFHKTRNLFAMNLAKKAKWGKLILAEGYMDVISLHQAGFDCAVASLGTALTGDQAKLMSRYSEEVVICYDSDGAGQKAAQRAIDILNKTGLAVRVLKMPGAKDPDEFIREQGREAFLELLNKPQTDIEYRLSQIKARYSLEDDEGRISYLKEAAALLAQISSSVEREIFANNVAKEAGVSEQAMQGEVKRVMAQRRRKQKAERERRAQNPTREFAAHSKGMKYSNVRSAKCEEGLLVLALKDGDLLQKAGEKIAPQEFSSDYLGKIYAEALKRREQGLELSPAACLVGLEEDQARYMSGLLATAVNSPDPERALQDYISVIKFEHSKQTEDGDELFRLALERQRRNKG